MKAILAVCQEIENNKRTHTKRENANASSCTFQACQFRYELEGYCSRMFSYNAKFDGLQNLECCEM